MHRNSNTLIITNFWNHQGIIVGLEASKGESLIIMYNISKSGKWSKLWDKAFKQIVQITLE